MVTQREKKIAFARLFCRINSKAGDNWRKNTVYRANRSKRALRIRKAFISTYTSAALMIRNLEGFAQRWYCVIWRI